MRKLFLFIILIIVVVALVKVYSISDAFKSEYSSREVTKAEDLVSEKINQDNGIDTLDLEVFEKEINPYNNCIFYDFSEYEPKKDFISFYKENGELKIKEVDYKILDSDPLDFYDLKIQNIKIGRFDINNKIEYEIPGLFIVDKNNKKMFFTNKIWDYKKYDDRLMILCYDYEPNGVLVNHLYVLNIYHTPENKLIGIKYDIPKLCSTHTNRGLIIDAKIVGSNYIWCHDYQEKLEIYRVSNSKYDYEENSKKADKRDKDKYDMYPEQMKLMWQKNNGIKENKEIYIKVGLKINDKRAHDYINEPIESKVLEIIDHLSDNIAKAL